MAESERILVGAIAGAFGVRGEVRLKSFCAEPRAIASYGPLWSEDGSRRFDLRTTRPLSGAAAGAGGLAARIAGIDSREAAEALRGTRLYAERARLPGLPDEEFYHADLIGLEVLDTGGQVLGRVAAVFDHGAGDILEIRPAGGPALLLPFTRACVPTVDLRAGRLIADPPPEAGNSGTEGTAADTGATDRQARRRPAPATSARPAETPSPGSAGAAALAPEGRAPTQAVAASAPRSPPATAHRAGAGAEGVGTHSVSTPGQPAAKEGPR